MKERKKATNLSETGEMPVVAAAEKSEGQDLRSDAVQVAGGNKTQVARGEGQEPRDDKGRISESDKKDGRQGSRADKRLRASIVVLIIGLVALAAGLAFMLIRLSQGAGLRDAEYLVEMGAWAREDAPGVVWEFTEVGKGRLTTNDGVNEYSFLWAIEGDTLLIETDWLYTLNDTYQYQLDQGGERLVLDGEVVFRPKNQD